MERRDVVEALIEKEVGVENVGNNIKVVITIVVEEVELLIADEEVPNEVKMVTEVNMGKEKEAPVANSKRENEVEVDLILVDLLIIKTLLGKDIELFSAYGTIYANNTECYCLLISQV